MDIYIVDPSKPLSDEPLDYLDSTEFPTITDVDLFYFPSARGPMPTGGGPPGLKIN